MSWPESNLGNYMLNCIPLAVLIRYASLFSCCVPVCGKAADAFHPRGGCTSALSVKWFSYIICLCGTFIEIKKCNVIVVPDLHKYEAMRYTLARFQNRNHEINRKNGIVAKIKE